MPSEPAPLAETLVRRIYDEMLNEGRFDVAAELYAPGHRLHDPQLVAAEGPRGMVDALATFRRGMDDVRWDVHDVLVDGDRVVVRWSGHGVHVGVVQGQLPRGRTVGPVHGISIHRVEDGKVAETWQVSDALGLLQQMGIVPKA